MNNSSKDEPSFVTIMMLPFMILVLCPLVFIATNWLDLFIVTRSLGTDFSTQALYKYLDSSIAVGLSNQDAHDRLAKVTPLFVTSPRISLVAGTTCEWVSLYVVWVPAVPIKGWICYGSDMRVISAGDWNASLP